MSARKNFKPHSKQSKLVNSYRKKTIDPGVDLNIKKDDDNMENIDDYWNMAEYVMDDDQTLPLKKNIPKDAQELMKKKMPTKTKKEVSKKNKDESLKKNKDESSKKNKDESSKKNKGESSKKNKGESSKKNKGESLKQETPLKEKKGKSDKKELNKKEKKQDSKKYVVESLESSVINDVMDISTDASKLTSDFKKSKQTKPENEESEDTLFDINNIRESLSHNTLKKMSNTSNTSGFDMNYDVPSINEISKTNNSEMGMQKLKDEKKKKEKRSKEEKKSKENKVQPEHKVKQSNPKNENVSKVNDSVKRRRSSVAAMTSYKGEPLIGKNNKIYGMTKISSLFQGRSKLEPLITKKSLEAGILFLKPGASILQETADNSFTLFLLKGTIEISMNNEKFKLDRESCMFIEEGSSYDIVDKSRSGSSMFVTFKAK